MKQTKEEKRIEAKFKNVDLAKMLKNGISLEPIYGFKVVVTVGNQLDGMMESAQKRNELKKLGLCP